MYEFSCFNLNYSPGIFCLICQTSLPTLSSSWYARSGKCHLAIATAYLSIISTSPESPAISRTSTIGRTQTSNHRTATDICSPHRTWISYCTLIELASEGIFHDEHERSILLIFLYRRELSASPSTYESRTILSLPRCMHPTNTLAAVTQLAELRISNASKKWNRGEGDSTPARRIGQSNSNPCAQLRVMSCVLSRLSLSRHICP